MGVDEDCPCKSLLSLPVGSGGALGNDVVGLFLAHTQDDLQVFHVVQEIIRDLLLLSQFLFKVGPENCAGISRLLPTTYIARTTYAFPSL